MKSYNFLHFSGQNEIVDFLNEPQNENVVPVSVNNDENGNWWLIYYEEEFEKTIPLIGMQEVKLEKTSQEQTVVLVPEVVINERLKFLLEAAESSKNNSNYYEETKYRYAINLFNSFFRGMQKCGI